MDFDEAVKYLFGLGNEVLTIKLGLRNTELLLQALDNPEHAFPSVQIAGTNGKGSTAAMLDSICRAAGIRSGLYTSPHLVSVTERIRISGVEISHADFARHTTTVRAASEQIDALPTFFEQMTAIALLAFREAGVELAILETGMGGRLDSTTAAGARVVAITQIAMDHEQYLGQTIQQIAAEKAAIIRPGVKAIIGRQQYPEALSVLLQRCAETGVEPTHTDSPQIIDHTPDGRFCIYDRICIGLRGRHQIENALVAIKLAESLSISREPIISGIENAQHPGRLELIPPFLLDGAHNPAGAEALRDYLNEFAPRPLTIVFGAMSDKKLDQIGEILFPLADTLILTTIDNPRSASLETLRPIAARFARASVIESPSTRDAMQASLHNEGLICVTGSLYLIGEWKQNHMTTPHDELPKIISSQKVFEGRVFNVTVDTVREGELTYQREVVHHHGSAVILPVFDDGTVALVRQYRHPAVRYLLEAPAGTLDDGERPDDGAARELQEELGLVAARLEKLSEFFVSPGFCEEKMWVFLATELTDGPQHLDEDEVLDVVRLPFEEALEMITSGEIQDAKTIIALILAAPRVGSPLLEMDYPAV